jgi:Leucine-rich repeat (LRR) protein
MSEEFVLLEGEKVFLNSSRDTYIDRFYPRPFLDLSNKNIKDTSSIGKLDSLNNLKTLFLNNNQITTIEGLKHLSCLEHLILSENKISKIESLASLSKLKTLLLDKNQITRIEGLEQLRELTQLYLDENEIISIEGLENLFSLHSLSLEKNKISKIQGLTSLKALKFLYLSFNSISKIEGIEALIDLTLLIIHDNKIRKIEGLETLTNLKVLNLDYNKISIMEGLEMLENLETLCLNHNFIRRIPPLTTLKSLNLLELDHNKLDHVEDLKHVEGIDTDVGNNPITGLVREIHEKNSEWGLDELDRLHLRSYRDEDMRGLNANVVIPERTSGDELYGMELDFYEFKINQYLSLKLEYREINIYVGGGKFKQCTRLFLQIPKDAADVFKQADSIDEAMVIHDTYLFQSEVVEGQPGMRVIDQACDIPLEQEFWGHASNLQTWAEHDYDTRLLHSNLSFPLLKRLTECGDPVAKRVFKEEIAVRFKSGYFPVITYLAREGYLQFLNVEEKQLLLEDTIPRYVQQIKDLHGRDKLVALDGVMHSLKGTDIMKEYILTFFECINDLKEWDKEQMLCSLIDAVRGSVLIREYLPHFERAINKIHYYHRSNVNLRLIAALRDSK